ncbi:head-tail connector protein [Prevotella copri]|jgi:uncharacterized phage protein (predicted DNA packaging)|uniref:Head-tail connector protein n=1 Tax=Segatella copri TaxID=165179 RepID=A0A6I2TVG9_9BACT|nr:head-tail connector protein [Segatella copri]MCW4098811.1 head-tail connector protein [Segatella copri]MCW4132831.1 head-tail connector protein [Segatella copri]MCW4163151.1 head-tail connector protein [Segatella copri]MST77766.1 phage gp6-like head-tail connector protein [Segatella copri]
MAVVSLDVFKKHVRADDFADDDDYLTELLETAESAVIKATNRSKDELEQMEGKFPPMLKHAMMMLAAHWYNQRESVSTVQMHAVPDALQALIKPFRKLVDDSGKNEI